MKRKTSEISKKNDLKIKAIYALLLIVNIVFFIGLIVYHSNFSIDFNLETTQSVAAAVASICILGYVSGRLPKLKGLGESSVIGIAYSLTICLIGLIISYFGQIIDISLHFGPYLDMFGILCGVLIFVILATNLKPFQEILNRKFTRKNQLICLIIFASVGVFSSYAFVNINGAPANIRSLIVMISGLFGGPVVGIPVGIISAAYRLSLGGSTAIPSAISTVLSGIIGSLIFIWNDKKFPKIIPATVLMFLFTGFEMLLIIIMTPPNISFSFIQSIYPIMLFASVTGMLLFSIVIRGRREKLDGNPSEEEQKITELENELKEYGEKIEKLENEIEELKKNNEKN